MNELMRGSWPGGYKLSERRLGERGADWASKWAGPAGLDPLRPSPRPPLPSVASRVFESIPHLHVGPWCQFLFGLDEAPSPARFNIFLTWSSEFSIFSGLVRGLLGVMFTSLLDLYRASRSCHEVLNELIPEVLLSTLKSCINTKLQNRHAQRNLLYQGG
jgi:hypothetical protein